MREQLSGACTTEIAAFDEFVGLLAGDARGVRPHHLRHGAHRPHPAAAEPAQGLDRLPRGQRPGCVLPRAAFRAEDAARTGSQAACRALGDPARTRIVLVTRADRAALRRRRALPASSPRWVSATSISW